MKHILRKLARAGRLFACLAAVVIATGCGLDKKPGPSALVGPSDFIGPAEFGLSVTLTANPDQLPRDGASQSVVTVTVRDQDGAAYPRPQRFSLGFEGTPPDGAQLSQTELTVPAGAGSGSFAVVAPSQNSVGSSVLIVAATPIDRDAANAVSRTVMIALGGTPNTTLPAPSFTVTPAAPEIAQDITFDASGTTDEGVVCRDKCSYAWSFGDGGAASGRIVTRRYLAPGRYQVVLTVVDSAGATATLTQFVSVIQPAAPAVTLAAAPATPLAGQQTALTATAVPANGHSIVRYEWSFGDGETATTTSRSVLHAYAKGGTYSATVTVYDDLGQSGSAGAAVIVGSGISGTITISPTNPSSGQTVRFDGSGSTTQNGATIVEYQWDFGNGHTETTAGPVGTTTYGSANIFTVRLTVVDNLGRTATLTTTVTITP